MNLDFSCLEDCLLDLCSFSDSPAVPPMEAQRLPAPIPTPPLPIPATVPMEISLSPSIKPLQTPVLQNPATKPAAQSSPKTSPKTAIPHRTNFDVAQPAIKQMHPKKIQAAPSKHPVLKTDPVPKEPSFNPPAQKLLSNKRKLVPKSWMECLPLVKYVKPPCEKREVSMETTPLPPKGEKLQPALRSARRPKSILGKIAHTLPVKITEQTQKETLLKLPNHKEKSAKTKITSNTTHARTQPNSLQDEGILFNYKPFNKTTYVNLLIESRNILNSKNGFSEELKEFVDFEIKKNQQIEEFKKAPKCQEPLSPDTLIINIDESDLLILDE